MPVDKGHKPIVRERLNVSDHVVCFATSTLIESIRITTRTARFCLRWKTNTMGDESADDSGGRLAKACQYLHRAEHGNDQLRFTSTISVRAGRGAFSCGDLPT